ncbi:MAG TPA: hypothetical protein VLH83_04185, partial [Chthoniobacterales bacterium]|nr:hypothetical protein [Chthoniobacterales bacterium]
HVDRARISERVVLVDPEVANEKEFAFHGGLEEAQIDGGARPEFSEIEFRQAIVEAAQTRQLGVNGETGVFVNAAVVFVKTESGGLERARGEIAADVFVRDVVQFGVGF